MSDTETDLKKFQRIYKEIDLEEDLQKLRYLAQAGIYHRWVCNQMTIDELENTLKTLNAEDQYDPAGK